MQNRIVYLAGKFRDPRIPLYLEELQRIPGISVTHDWTMEKDKPQREAAIFDMEGVSRCDVFVAVMDDMTYDYRGTFTELGGALALGKPILLVKGCDEQYARTNCFFLHPSIFHVTSFDAVLRILSSPKKLLILGPGKHGKDTVAEKLAQGLSVKFASSSETANAICVFPTLSKKYGYETLKECFDDRQNHRVEWYELICEYNREDKTRLTREILRLNDIYVGMRDDSELENSRPLFDLVLWVDASDRVKELDPSLHINMNDSDLIVGNNESPQLLYDKMEKLMYLLK